MFPSDRFRIVRGNKKEHAIFIKLIMSNGTKGIKTIETNVPARSSTY